MTRRFQTQREKIDQIIARVYGKTGSVRAAASAAGVSEGHVSRRLVVLNVEPHRNTWTRPKIREALDVYAQTNNVNRVVEATGMSRSAVNRLLKAQRARQKRPASRGRYWGVACPPGYERITDASKRVQRTRIAVREALEAIQARPLEKVCYKVADVDRALTELEFRKQERVAIRQRRNWALVK